MAERQTNYTIGEGLDLPSKGKIYGVDCPAQVELRSMTARDEMKRLSPSTTQFKNLAEIIEGCMIEKYPVHVYDLALGDYEYLLHRLRIVTYGDEYKLVLRCPYCGEEIETVAHLEELHVKEFDLEKFEEVRTITLPRSGHTVTLKFQTPRMLDEVESKTKEMKRKFRTAEINFELLTLLSSVIDTVDGTKLDSVRLEGFINKLPALDMTKILNSVDILNAQIGIDNNLSVECPKCGGEVRTSFRFGSEFFRPSNI
jgi:predicted RNA-binding Zn-ribbon protein involved in translation (DUF1610 family)